MAKNKGELDGGGEGASSTTGGGGVAKRSSPAPHELTNAQRELGRQRAKENKAKRLYLDALRGYAIINRQITEIEHRETLLNDLVQFCHVVCGFKDVSPSLHGDVERFIKGSRSCVVLLPREHLKSSFITVGYTCQLVANNPNIRVCIASVTEDLSKQFLRQIKAIIRSPKFQKLWGDRVSPDFEKDTGDVLALKGRSHTIREPTVYATSVGASQIGYHFDHFLYDDIVDNNTVRTKTSMDNCWQWFCESLALHDRNSSMIYVGTRWHDYDVAGRLLEDDSYDHMVRSIRENGQIIFPEKFTDKRIRLLKKRLPRRVFACQYMNDPVPVEDQVFPEHWLLTWSGQDAPDGLRFMACDPSTGDGDDYSAIVTVTANHLGQIIITDIVRQRVPPKLLIDYILSACEKWGPTKAGLEQNALQKTLGHWLQDVMYRENRRFFIQELRVANRLKEDRILSLEPYMREGRIYIWEKCPHRTELIDEMIRFPRAKTDDILDALAHTLDLLSYPAPPSEGPVPLPEREQLYREWYVAQCKVADSAKPTAYVLGTAAVRPIGRRGEQCQKNFGFLGTRRSKGARTGFRAGRGR